ncbi:MAG: ABC transporter permease [Phycisphaerales bacterium]|nr:ABC transporter permease [Phycisphaerales bacterium]
MSKNADQLQETLESVTGVQLAQGIGHTEVQGFWAEAWGQVLRRPAAVAGIVWVSIIAFFAIFSPLIASGHPIIAWPMNADGSVGAMTSPLINTLKSSDVVLILLGLLAPVIIFFPTKRLETGERLRLIIAAGAQSGIMVILARLIESYFTARDASESIRDIAQSGYFVPLAVTIIAALSALPFILISIFAYRSWSRCAFVLAGAIFMGLVISWKWSPKLYDYSYRTQESNGQIRTVFTLIPFSPDQSETPMYNRPPGSTPMNSMWDSLELAQRIAEDRAAIYSDDELAGIPVADIHFERLRSISRSINPLTSDPLDDFINQLDSDRPETLLDLRQAVKAHPTPSHHLGTDTLGQDVFSQMLHACRLAISIGFISTSIAVVIGVTIGSLMGYFGGWVDFILYRFVEIFMAIPVLFLLIVAAGVLPRNTYVMMAIIGCFTWTGAARFIRAEFMKLRETDYIQAAKVMGLPLWSILFKHMLPNGVTPVLVESSFLIAAAILIEATLSFLGLGPTGQASWGSLLRNASGETGAFVWWLAIFPGAAIFLTTLAYNLIGEALRDAIDPKLKKARV